MKFGTDGIRGKAGVDVTESLAFALGNTVARVVGKRVWVARDPRPSSPALAEATLEGIVSAGGHAIDLGVLPTPGLSWRVAQEGGQAGVMVTASHNPAEDNGLKVVFGDGKKLSTGILAGISKELERPQRLGGGWRETRENAEVSYVNTLLAALPPGRWLAGQRILFDSAMGAGAAAGRRVLEALGAEVEPFAGRAINDRCGAVHPQFAAIVVRERACAAGLVIDGDGDRVALINARGQVLDGDAILWLLREGPAMVGTVMSNLGLERALLGEGIRLERAAVGDANVAARMSEIGASLGGEPSGHILVRNGCPTSDGLHVGLLALARGLELDTSGYTPFPQAHASLRNAKRVEVNTDFVMLAGGRAVVRRSGTEAVVRVMIEHSDINLANSLRDRVVALLLENP